MKHLSKINETHWGGMVKRSSSDVQRKENDVNSFDRLEFYDYIKSHYKCDYIDTEPNYIAIDIKSEEYRTLSLIAIYDDQIKRIKICGTRYLNSETLSILKKKYASNSDYIRLEWVIEDSVSNRKFLDILDTIIEKEDNLTIVKV